MAIVGLFHTQTVPGQYFWYITTVFFNLRHRSDPRVCLGALPHGSSRYGLRLDHKLFGRATGSARAPHDCCADSGHGNFLGDYAGSDWPRPGAVLVLRYAPETKGLSLEEIQDHLEQGRV